MKLKGLTKLALSGVALAAVAATLGTSTYAWYVSNSTATVSGITGSSASVNSGNILVSQLTTENDVLKETGGWTNILNSVTLKSTPALNPVTQDGNSFTPKISDSTADGYIAPTGWHDISKTPVAANVAYGYYAFGLQSSAKAAADLKFGIENSTTQANFKFQTAYNLEGLNAATTGIALNDQFTSDFINALKLEVFVTELTASSTIATAQASGKVGAYNANSCYNTSLAAPYAGITTANTGDGTKIVTGGDAHAYYKKLSNENVTGTTIDGGESSAVTLNDLSSGKVEISLPFGTNSEVKKYVVLVRYWLEGTDTDCFDSCINQSFALNFELEAKTPTGA